MKGTIQFNPVGSTFYNDDPRMPTAKLEVVEQKNNEPSCRGCFYAKKRIKTCNRHACTPFLRMDKKHVIFKPIKTEGL